MHITFLLKQGLAVEANNANMKTLEAQKNKEQISCRRIATSKRIKRNT